MKELAFAMTLSFTVIALMYIFHKKTKSTSRSLDNIDKSLKSIQEDTQCVKDGLNEYFSRMGVSPDQTCL